MALGLDKRGADPCPTDDQVEKVGLYMMVILDKVTLITLKMIRPPLSTSEASELSTRVPVPQGCSFLSFVKAIINILLSVPGRQTTEKTTIWPFMGKLPRYLC